MIFNYYPLPIDNMFSIKATNMSREDPDPAGSVNNWPLESGSVSQDYGSADTIVTGGSLPAEWRLPPFSVMLSAWYAALHSELPGNDLRSASS
jgi:hypothetical protein